MQPLVSRLLAPLILFISSLHAADAPQARLDEKHRAFFKDYCVECHNEKKQKGKLRLDDVSFVLDSLENADRWQKILNQINSGEMPPEDSKQPERGAKTEFLDALSHTLVTARQSLGDVRGKITMRRLNRREYKNTIRDLLGVDLRVNELPADGGAGSFDTVGSSLFMSSDQFEQYLALGRQALDEHFARFVAPPPDKPRLMHVEAEERNARIAKSLAERTDAHERYEKWTSAVNAAAAKAENTDIVTQIRAEKKGDATHLFFAWQRIKDAPSPADFGFTDAVHADEQGRRNWVHSVPQQRAYLAHPAAKTGSFLTIEDVFANPYQPFRIPGDWPAGDYVVRVRIAATHYRSGFLQNHDNEKLVLKDITLVDAPGAISGGGGRNDKVAYLNVDVVPDPRFPDCRLAGHASSEGGRIAAWIEQCEFHLLGDDNYNTGYFFDYELLEQSTPQKLTMKIQPWDELIFPGDRLRFADQKTNRGLGEAIVLTVDNSTKDKVTVTLDRGMPALPAGTIASNNHGTQRFVYRRNHQFGGRGHGLKFKGYGALIEDNTFENIAGIGIYLGCPEGPETIARSADMVTVRRNAITLCGWHSIEAGQVAAPSERLRIEDNVIRDSKTAGIFLVNVHCGLVRGNTFESVTRHFTPMDKYQSLHTEGCTDIRAADEVLRMSV